MPQSCNLARLSLLRPASPGELWGPLVPPNDPFTMLVSQACSVPLIEVTELAGGPGSGEGSIALPPGQVWCGHPLQFRCALPSGMEEAQALLFERDKSGAVYLLSHAALLDEAVWYRRVVDVPRNDAMPDGSGAIGDIKLREPGRSELLLVCCRNPDVRLDGLAAFRRSAATRRVGSLEFPRLTEAELRELAELVCRSSPKDRAVIAGSVTVVPDMTAIDADLQRLPGLPDYVSDRISTDPVRARPVG